MTMVEEQTVVQSYDRGLRVIGLVAVPAAEVATVEDISHAPIPWYRCAVVIVNPRPDPLSSPHQRRRRTDSYTTGQGGNVAVVTA